MLVNPYEIEKVAGAIHNALTMDKAEAEIRMVSLRSREQKYDLKFLLNTFLKEMGSFDMQGERDQNTFFSFQKYRSYIISMFFVQKQYFSKSKFSAMTESYSKLYLKCTYAIVNWAC